MSVPTEAERKAARLVDELAEKLGVDQTPQGKPRFPMDDGEARWRATRAERDAYRVVALESALGIEQTEHALTAQRAHDDLREQRQALPGLQAKAFAAGALLGTVLTGMGVVVI